MRPAFSNRNLIPHLRPSALGYCSLTFAIARSWFNIFGPKMTTTHASPAGPYWPRGLDSPGIGSTACRGCPAGQSWVLIPHLRPRALALRLVEVAPAGQSRGLILIPHLHPRIPMDKSKFASGKSDFVWLQTIWQVFWAVFSLSYLTCCQFSNFFECRFRISDYVRKSWLCFDSLQIDEFFWNECFQSLSSWFRNLFWLPSYWRILFSRFFCVSAVFVVFSFSKGFSSAFRANSWAERSVDRPISVILRTLGAMLNT